MGKKRQQIKIRDWKIGDVQVFRKWNSQHYKWMDFNGPYYKNMTKEEVEDYLSKIKDNIKNNSFSFPRDRMVIANIHSDEMIGLVSSYWESKETNWLCIGLCIYDEENWSKGIGFEALLFWCKYLFDNRPELVRLDMRTWSGHFGMMKLAEKLGFTLEARFRKARIVKGEYFDSIGYGILREEFDSDIQT